MYNSNLANTCIFSAMLAPFTFSTNRHRKHCYVEIVHLDMFFLNLSWLNYSWITSLQNLVNFMGQKLLIRGL